ncbi:MAG: 50S ribosomal protein L13 [Candidatus Moraniibacteriota bacterium]|nr:MAG: 50S ribosomal protein L13 [Candidatus Moranbacteria bacterium]
MKSTTTKTTKRTVHLFDAQGKVLGRLATEIATVLSGKDQVSYTPHLDGGASVVVMNTDGIEVTGNKPNSKIYNRFSGYPGGITAISFKDQRKKDSRKLIWQAVYGMLPKNSLRAKMLTRLKLFRTAEYGKRVIDVTH